jgi:D-glycero-alpha-D-manno-heptose 1-phosphate guanylyltransferase
MPLPLLNIDAAILVGGLGSRLRPVICEMPKPLAPVLGRPFLFYLLDMLALRGARSVTLCCSFRAELIRETVGSCWLGMPVLYSMEDEPLGTGGALRLAATRMQGDRILAMNGDSWFEPDWDALLGAARDFPATLAAMQVPDVARYGTIELDEDSRRVAAFREKAADGSSPRGGWINSGIYILDRNWLTGETPRPCSLENEMFPPLVADGKLSVVAGSGPFLDIGIPADYERAADFVDSLDLAPHSMFPDFPEMADAAVKLGTCVVIRDDAGRVLLERRSDCGWWCLPGGKMDAGETLEECALREAREETGLSVRLDSFLGIFSDPTRRTVRYPDNGDLRQLVDAAWLATPAGGSLEKSPESLDLRWFDLHHLPLNTVPPVVEILRAIP